MNFKISFTIALSSVFIFSVLFSQQNSSDSGISNAVSNSAASRKIEILASTEKIIPGGSAVIIFRVSDTNFSSIYVADSAGNKYLPVQMQEKDIFAFPFAWPIYSEKFKASLIIEETNQSISTNSLIFKVQKVEYRVYRLPLSTDFSKDKLKDLGKEGTNIPSGDLARYNYLMKSFQENKAINIVTLTSQMDTNIYSTNWVPFNPLPGARISAPYGEHRYFTINKKNVRESYHLGLDMAKGIHGKITASNAGKIVFAGFDGANGNMIIISHGLGLYTLYAHCSVLMVKTGDIVREGTVIAKSGETGYATGDHLHFSVILLGKYVNPMEWMSGKLYNGKLFQVFGSILQNLGKTSPD